MLKTSGHLGLPPPPPATLELGAESLGVEIAAGQWEVPGASSHSSHQKIWGSHQETYYSLSTQF